MKRRVFERELRELCPQNNWMVVKLPISERRFLCVGRNVRRRLSNLRKTFFCAGELQHIAQCEPLDDQQRSLLLGLGLEVEGNIQERVRSASFFSSAQSKYADDEISSTTEKNTLNSYSAAFVEPEAGTNELPVLALHEAITVLSQNLHMFFGGSTSLSSVDVDATVGTKTAGVKKIPFVSAVGYTHRRLCIDWRGQKFFALVHDSRSHTLRNVQIKQICGLGDPLVFQRRASHTQ